MRIVCPSDGSAQAAAAIDKVIATLMPEDVMVELLGVAGDGAHETDSAGHRTARLEAHLAGERERLEAAGFSVETSLGSGAAAARILAYLDTVGPDLVVVGSGPPGGQGLSGRAAAAVARSATVPVLIARDGLPVTGVVLGYDESPDADAALALLARLPWRSPPTVHVCSTWEVGDTILPSALGDEAVEPHEAPLQDLLESRLAGLDIAREAAGRLRSDGILAVPHVRRGRPSAELEIVADEAAAGLIAVGSRGLSSAERFLLGSTSDELVATARTSVLIVRAPG